MKDGARFAAIVATRDLTDEMPLFLAMLGCTDVEEDGTCTLDEALHEDFSGAAVARVGDWTVLLDHGFPVTRRDVVPGLNSRFERTLASKSAGAGEVVHVLSDGFRKRWAVCRYTHARQVRGWMVEDDAVVEDHGEPFEDTEEIDLDKRIVALLTERVDWEAVEEATFRVFRYTPPPSEAPSIEEGDPFAAIVSSRDLTSEMPTFLAMLGCTEVEEGGTCSLGDALREDFSGAAVARVGDWTVVLDHGFPVTRHDVVPGLNSRFERTLASKSAGPGEVLHLLSDGSRDRWALCRYTQARQVRGWMVEDGTVVEDHGEPFEDTDEGDLHERVVALLMDRVDWEAATEATFRVFHYVPPEHPAEEVDHSHDGRDRRNRSRYSSLTVPPSPIDDVPDPGARRAPAEPEESEEAEDTAEAEHTAEAGDAEELPVAEPVEIWPPVPEDLDEADYGWSPEDDLDDDEQVEQALRWRLVLGQFSEDRLGMGRLRGMGGMAGEEGSSPGGGGLSGMLREAERMDQSLEFVYEREFAERSHRQAGGGGGGGLSVPAWLRGVRDLFPEEAVQVIENDALVRYGMTELVTDPEILRKSEPTEDLMKAILQFKHMMKGEVLEAAREVVSKVVDKLAEKLRTDCTPALSGPVDPHQRPPRRVFRNVDWHRTILRNLKNYDPDRERIIAERITFRHRQRMKSNWRVVIAVDQSGSMMDSLIHSSVMAGIFSSLPTVDCHLVLWDHRVMDVSHLANDPLEVLMTCQLGGGTQMLPAMQYCSGLITEPENTIFVLISDWYIWGEQQQCLAMAHSLNEAGVKGIGLCALDADCRPIYDERFAKDLAGQGWFVAALTPKQLAEHVGRVIA